MATTTNYGWTTPDDTALVKDGASAIRTLGSSVDTTTKNLNPETTLGDIAYRSSTANVKTRLGIGTTGQVLTVTGGVPAWSTISAGGITLLSTTTLSGVSTTVSGISGSYKKLFIEVYGAIWGTGNDSTQFEINNAAFTSVRKLDTASVSTTSLATTVNLNDGATSIVNTGGNNYFSFNFDNYSSSTDYKTFTVLGCYEGALGNGRTAQFFGGFASDTAITSFTYASVTGYTFSAGTIKVYGVN